MKISKQFHEPAPWLLLMFGLPARRASQRVSVWRQLQRYGALPLRKSGYLLPNNPVNRERFEWLATAICKHGGEAWVVAAQSIGNTSSPHLVQRFIEARSRDYQELIQELNSITSGHGRTRNPTQVRRLRSQFHEIAAIDFFANPLRERVEELLGRAETLRSGSSSELETIRADHQEYKGRFWVTRPRPGIDRSASAWLIRRSIDPRARFAFAPEGGVPEGAVPFDMFHGGFGHRGEDCTFETLQKAFRIRNHKMEAIAQIIHDADLLDEKFGRREGFGIDEVLKGWARQGIADKELLARGMQLIEGLYHSLA